MARLLPAAALAAVAALAVLASPATAQDEPSALPAPLAYMNHTVGGADGWFFNATGNTTSGNYSSWAAGETFYLGDYLIFKTNDNSSVVVTSNSTTYSLCDPSEDDGMETYIYSDGGLAETDAIAVPLLYEGTNYFFSEAGSGVQCQQGMRFQIKVAHGHGLPPALAHPPAPAPPPEEHVLAPPPAGSAFSVSQGPVAASDSAGVGTASDYTDGKNAGCRAVGSRFLGGAIVVTLAFLVVP